MTAQGGNPGRPVAFPLPGIGRRVRHVGGQREISLVGSPWRRDPDIDPPAALLRPATFRSIFLSAAVVATIAIGQALVVLTRNVDLSVGSGAGLCAFVVAASASQSPGLPFPVLVAEVVALGAVLGAINGALVTVGRVPAIVATLGTLYAYRGIAFLIAGGDNISASELPGWFLGVSAQQVAGVPVLVLVPVVLAVVMAYVARSLVFGRSLYAVGDNPQAARLREPALTGPSSGPSFSVASSRGSVVFCTRSASARWTPWPAPVSSSR